MSSFHEALRVPKLSCLTQTYSFTISGMNYIQCGNKGHVLLSFSLGDAWFSANAGFYSCQNCIFNGFNRMRTLSG